MIRFAQVKDIPVITKLLADKACFLSKGYLKALPVYIMMKQILLSSDSNKVNGILGFSQVDTSGNTVAINCFYVFSAESVDCNHIAISLLKKFIHKFVAMSDFKVILQHDCLGNRFLDTNLFSSLGFHVRHTKYLKDVANANKQTFNNVIPASSLSVPVYSKLLDKVFNYYKVSDSLYAKEYLLGSRRDSLILMQEDKPIGLVVLQSSEDGVNSGIARIRYLYIDNIEDYHYASNLILAAINHASKRGARYLEIELDSLSEYAPLVDSFTEARVNYDIEYSALRSNLLEKLTKISAEAGTTTYFG